MSFIAMQTEAFESQYRPGEQLSLAENERRALRYGTGTYLDTMSIVSLVLEYTV